MNSASAVRQSKRISEKCSESKRSNGILNFKRISDKAASTKESLQGADAEKEINEANTGVGTKHRRNDTNGSSGTDKLRKTQNGDKATGKQVEDHTEDYEKDIEEDEDTEKVDDEDINGGEQNDVAPENSNSEGEEIVVPEEDASEGEDVIIVEKDARAAKNNAKAGQASESESSVMCTHVGQILTKYNHSTLYNYTNYQKNLKKRYEDEMGTKATTYPVMKLEIGCFHKKCSTNSLLMKNGLGCHYYDLKESPLYIDSRIHLTKFENNDNVSCMCSEQEIEGRKVKILHLKPKNQKFNVRDYLFFKGNPDYNDKMPIKSLMGKTTSNDTPSAYYFCALCGHGYKGPQSRKDDEIRHLEDHHRLNGYMKLIREGDGEDNCKSKGADIRDLFKVGGKKLNDEDWYNMLQEHLIFNMIKDGDIFNKYEKSHWKSLFGLLAYRRLINVNDLSLPDPFKITKRKVKHHIEEQYKYIKNEIDYEVQSVLPTSITLSFDAWDGKRGQSFLGVIAKFVIMVRSRTADSNNIETFVTEFYTKSRTIALKEFTEASKSATIQVNMIKEICQSFPTLEKSKDSIKFIVTDNTSVNPKIATDLKIRKFPCVAHLLQLNLSDLVNSKTREEKSVEGMIRLVNQLTRYNNHFGRSRVQLKKLLTATGNKIEANSNNSGNNVCDKEDSIFNKEQELVDSNFNQKHFRAPISDERGDVETSFATDDGENSSALIPVEGWDLESMEKLENVMKQKREKKDTEKKSTSSVNNDNVENTTDNTSSRSSSDRQDTSKATGLLKFIEVRWSSLHTSINRFLEFSVSIQDLESTLVHSIYSTSKKNYPKLNVNDVYGLFCISAIIHPIVMANKKQQKYNFGIGDVFSNIYELQQLYDDEATTYGKEIIKFLEGRLVSNSDTLKVLRSFQINTNGSANLTTTNNHRQTQVPPEPDWLVEARDKILYALQRRYSLPSKLLTDEKTKTFEEAQLQYQTEEEFKSIKIMLQVAALTSYKSREFLTQMVTWYEMALDNNSTLAGKTQAVQKVKESIKLLHPKFPYLYPPESMKPWNKITHTENFLKEAHEFIETEICERWDHIYEYIRDYRTDFPSTFDHFNLVTTSVNQSTTEETEESEETEAQREAKRHFETEFSEVNQFFTGNSDDSYNEETRSETEEKNALLSRFTGKVKEQFKSSCNFMHFNDTKHQYEMVLINQTSFNLILKTSQLITLEDKYNEIADHKRNKSVSYWSMVYNQTPYFRELSIFLILLHSIPPTTVDVERLFKIPNKIETKKGPLLQGKTKEILTILQSEIGKDFIPLEKKKKLKINKQK